MKKILDNEWPKCCVCGKKKTVCIDGKYYCNKHYQSIRRYGHPYGKPRKSTNLFTMDEEMLVVKTKKGDIFFADKEDAEIITRHSWCMSKTGYAVANIGGCVIKIHRLVMGITDPQQLVDHKNGNTCDNRKKNLRICNRTGNARNKCTAKNCKSGHIGIRKTKEDKYNVRITADRKEIYIGNFDTLEEAIAAREEAEDKYHGEFGSHHVER